MLRLLFVLGTFAWIQAVSARVDRSDPELRQALIGTWQIELPAKRFYPLKTGFSTYRSDGSFVWVAIGEIAGWAARVDLEGKWSVENGALVERLTRVPDSSFNGRSEKSTFLSVEPSRIIVRRERGATQMRRARLPAKLPPTSHWIMAMIRSANLRKQYAVKTPQPLYPYEARKNYDERRGIFRLTVDPAGNVKVVQVLQSTGHVILDQAAVAGLKGWRLMPGRVNELVVPVIFTMRGL